jgi:hypothetical protein
MVSRPDTLQRGIVSAEAETLAGRAAAMDFLIQLGTLGGLALVLVASIHLLRGRRPS